MTNTNTQMTIKDLIGNGDGMANDIIFTEGKFEWFKSSEDGYIYTRNTETGRNTRYNAEGQNGKRISDDVYFTECNKALDRRNEMLLDAAEDPAVSVEQFCDLIAEDPKDAELVVDGGAVEFHFEDDRYHEEPEDVEEVFEADPAPKTEKKAKKSPRKAKKNAAFRMDVNGTEVTLTEKQVDFIRHLPDTCFWERGLDSAIWVDVLCDEIGGQFASKPMTVGAMISTICEKGLGVRGKEKVNGRKCTSFALTEMGKIVAKELGLN